MRSLHEMYIKNKTLLNKEIIEFYTSYRKLMYRSVNQFKPMNRITLVLHIVFLIKMFKLYN